MQVALGLVASTEPIRKSDNGAGFEMSYVYFVCFVLSHAASSEEEA